MLLIDGVKYNLWCPKDEVKEFHPIIEEHAKEIFGESSEYFDIKKRLESVTGKGSVPDGFVIVFSEQPCWHIVEIELSKHDLHDHIVNQISRFIVGINNPQTQKRIVNAINEYLNKDDYRRSKIKKDIDPREIRQFLDDVIDQKPILTIVIEERTPELDEVLKIFPQFEKRVIEFKTFTRQDVGLSVHAHLFEPLHKQAIAATNLPVVTATSTTNIIEITLKPWNIKYKEFVIPKDKREFFPPFTTEVEMDTDIGSIKVTCNPPSSSFPSYYISRLSKWFKAHPEIKIDDKLIIEVIEPMKKYRLRKA